MDVCEHETETPTDHQTQDAQTSQQQNRPITAEEESITSQREGEEPDKSDSGDKMSDVCVQRVCHTHERGIPMQETVEALDITEESEITF